MEPNRKKLLKDIFFSMQLAFLVIGSFIFAVVVGLWVDSYFGSSPIAVMLLLLLAFGYVIKLLLGAGKHE